MGCTISSRAGLLSAIISARQADGAVLLDVSVAKPILLLSAAKKANGHLTKFGNQPFAGV